MDLNSRFLVSQMLCALQWVQAELLQYNLRHKVVFKRSCGAMAGEDSENDQQTDRQKNVKN